MNELAGGKALGLSVIIVNWNTRDLLDQCLESVYRTVTLPSYDVWVVDNASTDGSADMVLCKYPQAHLLTNTENLGFGRANNQAMRLCSGETVLLLNSDIVLAAGAVDETWRLLDDHAEVGVLGCRLVGWDGLVQDSYGYRLPHGPSLHPKQTVLSDGLVSCAHVWAAYMLVRRSVIHDVGMFDEDFRVFHEDTDWCWRILRAGWRIAYCPHISVAHGCRQSAKSLPGDTYLRLLFVSEYTLFRKHHPRWLTVLQAGKRYLHYSSLAYCHRLAYRVTGDGRHAERCRWFGTARSMLGAMLSRERANRLAAGAP